MGFLKLTLKPEYRSFSDDIIKDFYIPTLQESVSYKRAVGYFSSTALIEISKGISGLIANSGKIQVIASPQLSESDIEAINKGYKSREEVINQSILDSLDLRTTDYYEKKRLNLLAHLISTGVLDIKIAFIEASNGIGIYHEKMGLLQDKEGNKIVFTGSLNETKSALSYNYESFDVFTSWTNDFERIRSKEDTFDKLWNNDIDMVETMDFPEIALEKFKGYIFEEPDLVMDEKELYRTNIDEEEPLIIGPHMPKQIKLRDYQLEAIASWKSKGFRGIFDMATGTGKTITGLAAVTELFKENNNRLAIVIVCPYQHLVEQWVEDIELFGMNPIIGYSTSKQRNWKRLLQDEVEYFIYGITNHFCLVTTNATFSSDSLQKIIKSVDKDIVLVIDEAHNFGADYLKSKLLSKANYRLGLSATIDRHNDEEGTKALYNYFGDKVIEYTLKMAIDNNMLTPYYYYPILIYLNSEELDLYRKLTIDIGKALNRDEGNFSDSTKFLMIKRARVVAGAQNKIRGLEKQIAKYKNESHMLVYCGAATINDPDYMEGKADEEEKRQIDVVTNLLGNKLDFKVSKFTSEESAEEREDLKGIFAEGKHLQALIAIRCLDEGVNIPSIKTAFILASSTNPKEYIQRRGRVLRKFEDKKYATIYDFITLPVSFDEAKSMDISELHALKSLPLREIDRMVDFASIAENSSVADGLINDIKDSYYLREVDIDDIEH
ncbi:DEAD/DEAH box helicase family protein [Sporosarcina siberiensis]|uniref:DEAD/DEAH box helicase family protein n=1 Tax=Sporosarcina siberiensis TaxID=1365606 RepID=A0ABW4SH47_9BACL